MRSLGKQQLDFLVAALKGGTADLQTTTYSADGAPVKHTQQGSTKA